MSSDIAIKLHNVSKSYQMFESPQDRLKQFLFSKKRKYYKEFWALKSVSFELKKGECLGIIGRNGSGKSTLLQIITGTLNKTDGFMDINGKIAALLELGSGFNPDFTGRENVYMNGTIMGLSIQEIEEKMSSIERFADIGHFIDQPVKVYSSGMFVRLAFACAIHVDPDILIVDEALAVGDLRFQLKCIKKMNEFKQQGKTILFVSHDVYSVRNFCDRAIWMKDGKIHMQGNVHEVTDKYQDFMKSGMEMDEPGNETSTQAGEVNAEQICIINKHKFMKENGEEATEFIFGEKITVSIEYTLNAKVEGLVGGIAIYDAQGTYVCGLNTKLDNVILPQEPGKYKLNLMYEDVTLMPGTYYIDAGFYEKTGIVNLDYKKKFAKFTISSEDYFAEGLTYLKHNWTLEGDKEL